VYDQPSNLGRRFGPGLIAFLAVLAIAAGSAGYFGARSVLAANNGSLNAGGPSNGPTSGGGSPNPNDGSNGGGGTPTNPAQTGSGSGGPATTAPQVAAGDPSTCPQPTVTRVAQAGLDSTLTVLLYVRVHRAGEYDSEIWICQNAAGELIYQGHILRKVLTVATSDSSLLLADGIHGKVEVDPGGNGYVATNPTTGGKTTEYHVTSAQLVTIDEPGDKNRQVYPAAS
jgi:hypothetical protein